MNVMQKLSGTPSLQKRVISYIQTGQFSPSKAVIEGTPQLPVLNANRPFFLCVTIAIIMFIYTELVS